MVGMRTIDGLVRRDLPADRAFEILLEDPDLRRWVGTDPVRRARLRDEFDRSWRTKSPASYVTTDARSGTLRATGPILSGVACPGCGNADVTAWVDRDRARFSCTRCDATFDDLLSIVPVVTHRRWRVTLLALALASAILTAPWALTPPL